MSRSGKWDLVQRLRIATGDRCGYCLSPQQLVLGVLEIDHLIPVSLGGSDDESNLWLACRMCNNFKAAQTVAIDPQAGQLVNIFNPRQDVWPDHFAGAATVDA